MERLLWKVVLVILSLTAVRAQIPIPKHPLGFTYKGGSSGAPIHLVAFVDLLCPDCQQAWPTIKKVADMYGPDRVHLKLQLFPLPYHTNAFIAAESVFVVNSVNSSMVIEWMDTLFQYQSQLYNFQTMNKNRYDVMAIIADLSTKIGFDKDTMTSGLSSGAHTEEAVISWKFGCSRTVAGTPYFFINGIFVSEALSTWTVDQWKELIDGLLNSGTY